MSTTGGRSAPQKRDSDIWRKWREVLALLWPAIRLIQTSRGVAKARQTKRRAVNQG